jgi:hypothetical protein
VVESVTPQQELELDSFWQRLDLMAQVAQAGDAAPVEPIAAAAKYQIQDRTDWVTAPDTAIVYDGNSTCWPRSASSRRPTTTRSSHPRRASASEAALQEQLARQKRALPCISPSAVIRASGVPSSNQVASATGRAAPVPRLARRRSG